MARDRGNDDDSSDAGSNDNDNRKEKKPKSRKPPNTAFRQQRLLAYAPILTPKTVLPLFFAVGIIFGPLGGLLLYASSKVQEITIDYTRCVSIANSSEFTNIPEDLVSTSFSGANSTGATQPQWRTLKQNNTQFDYEEDICRIRFTVPTDFTPPVMLYYRLTNFYQNHRRYVKSLDLQQLEGQNLSAAQLNSDGGCTPLITAPNGKPYYPCGLIANSLFNDTFTPPLLLNVEGGSSASNQTYNMTTQDIAWSSDSAQYGATTYTQDQVEPPPNWARRYPNGYDDDHPLPDLSTDYPFQVWMRTAGLPTFSKLALRNADDTMVAGTYQVDIGLNFPVTEYGGTKTMVLSTRTVIGGQNNFLGIAYVVVAGLCILLGAIFTARHLIKPRKLGDHQYLSWNTAPTASGREMNLGGVLTDRR